MNMRHLINASDLIITLVNTKKYMQLPGCMKSHIAGPVIVEKLVFFDLGGLSFDHATGLLFTSTTFL
jgi:hypothetical protein